MTLKLKFISLIIVTGITMGYAKAEPAGMVALNYELAHKLAVNHVLTQHENCYSSDGSCIQDAWNLLSKKGLGSFIHKKVKCIENYGTCLSAAQKNCSSTCPSQCSNAGEKLEACQSACNDTCK